MWWPRLRSVRCAGSMPCASLRFCYATALISLKYGCSTDWFNKLPENIKALDNRNVLNHFGHFYACYGFIYFVGFGKVFKTIYEKDLLAADVFVEEINMWLIQSLFLVLFADQCGNIHVGHITNVLVAIVALSSPHNAPNGCHTINFIISLLATVLVSHLFWILF